MAGEMIEAAPESTVITGSPLLETHRLVRGVLSLRQSMLLCIHVMASPPVVGFDF
ncbi:hypothetical protein DL93DRAFT_2090905 [Clavulina sp. PMI_390]|nr:hypothetical protein DL93DRAFT_2090902 [Clavulina sp. PMI_390]KAF8300515.1 hypothetical protein DL93DRAFT_2090905 [Clavulina sp. PMI_390]